MRVGYGEAEGAAEPPLPAEFDAMRAGNPVARALPLLMAIASRPPRDAAPRLARGGRPRHRRGTVTGLPASREEVARWLPHQGAMCLLDRVEACDAASIACGATSHRHPAHPLRRDGVLPAVCGLEYALQAMALHGALTAGAAQGQGFLAALSGVEMAVERLDDVAGDLRIAATALVQESRGFIYGFEVTGDGRLLLSGRATAVLA